MSIQPIGERVLLTQHMGEERTKSGIYIPDSANKDRKQGVVVAVGTYVDGKSLPLSAGDTVVYGGYSSEKFEHEGKNYMLIDFKDILAKIQNK